MSGSTTRTYTFVFTDIEGSTRLLRALGSEYQQVLRRHDTIVVQAAERAGGEAFGSEGDAQALVFDDATSAIDAAIASQRALEAEAWPNGERVRVRMGIHTGEAQRDEAGFVGLTLHETARISAAAHGGQVLLSPATAELVRGRLPADIELRDLGEHELRDIEAPIRLHQLCVEGLPQAFPPLRARTLARTSLPAMLTSFIERDEVESVAVLAEDARLLTLTGPGGTGKTRLAIAVAERIAGRFDGGTYFVALDAIREASLVVPEIISTLGMGSYANAPLQRLTEYLEDRAVLLVLDNLEQVVDAGAAISQLVAKCPRLTVLATSRIPLRVYGEQEFPVPALPLPTPNGITDTAVLGEVASVRLFVERARAAKPSFSLDDSTAADVAGIVARLDGLPLAIELAAARARMLAPAALRARLSDRLGTLTGGTRDRTGRQQTLRGAITWSHDLLDAPDRRLFARFGTIAGAAALAQIEAICGPADEIGRDVFQGIGSLVDQSLVQAVESDDDEPRFAMLSTISEYARERLAQSGEAERIERRHAEVYLALAEEAAPRLLGPDAATWNDRLEADHDDLRAALDWVVATREAELGLRLIVALWRFWQVRGHLYEADDRVHAVLAMPTVAGQSAVLQARGHLAAGGVTYWRLEEEPTRRHYEAALELARGTDDRALLAECLYNAGFMPVIDGLRARHEGLLGSTPYFEEALAIYRELEDQGGIGRTSWSMAIQAAARGDVEAARQLLAASLDAARSVDDTYQVGWALHLLGQSDVVVGDLEAASRHLRESLDIWAGSGDMSALTLLLIDAVIVARARGDLACSWRLVGAEERLRLATGVGMSEAIVEFADLEPRRTPETEEERAWFAEGHELTTDGAIAMAREVALRVPGG